MTELAKDDLISRSSIEAAQSVDFVCDCRDGSNKPCPTHKAIAELLIRERESSRRGVVERLREVVKDYYNMNATLFYQKYGSNDPLVVFDKTANILADEFAAADSGEMRTTTSGHSPVVIPQDIQLRVAKIRERRAAIATTAWQQGGQYWNSKTVTDSYGATFVADCGNNIMSERVASFVANAPTDIDTLLQIIDSLTGTRVTTPVVEENQK